MPVPTIESVLDLLVGPELEFREEPAEPLLVQEITVAGNMATVILDDDVSGEVRVGDYLYLDAGDNTGHHRILSVGPSIVTFREGVAEPGAGVCYFFRYLTSLKAAEDLIESLLVVIEKSTRQSFQRLKTHTEYLSGNNTRKLLLSRRHVDSASVTVEFLNYKNTDTGFEVQGPEGILVRTHRSWPSGDSNIKVVYDYGFTELPASIEKALRYYAAALFLGQQDDSTGGGSISIVSYSQSFPQAGKYGLIRKQYWAIAKSLLHGFSTGVTGG